MRKPSVGPGQFSLEVSRAHSVDNALFAPSLTRNEFNRNVRSHWSKQMNTLSTEPRHELLDRLRTIALLQNWLWDEAIIISDDLTVKSLRSCSRFPI